MISRLAMLIDAMTVSVVGIVALVAVR